MLTFANSWWNFDWAPTPDEWQALWAALTLATAALAAFLALRQLREMKVANIAASKANEEAAKASEAASLAARETTRPYLVVRFYFRPVYPMSPDKGPESGTTFVVIENIGRSAARDIRLSVSPEFQTSGDSWADGGTRAMEWFREKFDGNYVFRQISPGQQLSYMLDRTKSQMQNENNLPQHYEVLATYTNQSRTEHYEETHTLDAAAWHLSMVIADPIETIARQMRTMNSYEKTAQKTRVELGRNVKVLAERDFQTPRERPTT